MKLFMICLVFGLSVSEKLDRGYLPPPGASYAGGSPGDIQAPLEPPNKLKPTLNHIDSSQHEQYTPTGYSTITPVTTTSYAFTQTTTFPSIESYETTATIIDPITGLEVHSIGKPDYRDYAETHPDYSQNQDLNISNFESNYKPGVSSSTLLPDNQYIKTDVPINTNIQTQNRYINPNEIGTETESHIPGSKYTSQGLQLNPHNQLLRDQQSNFIGSQQSPQSITSNQVVDIKDSNQYVPNKNNKYYSDSINNINPEGITGQNKLQPIQYFDNVGSSTPTTTLVSSTLAYPSVFPINRPERPQAEADRNAVIINYENIRTPTGYYYSYDTSNGIHADESGSVEDGTKAQGSYSYIGDDGKVYSVIYNADEYGFQPRGDHLPTPPPIPEAIKEVIEQAARDKQAGIFDDGSYDEAKYGYKQYQQPMYKTRLQTQIFNNINDDIRKPIAGIAENDYIKDVVPYQFNNNINQNKNSNRPSNKINNEELTDGILQQNQKVQDDKDNKSLSEIKYGKNPNTYYNDQDKILKTQYYGQQPETHIPNNEASNELYHDKNAIIQGTEPVQETFGKETTRRPFLTPEVYNQLTFNQAENNRPSTTREPFTTSRVTSPKGNLNNDYDGEDYTTDPEIDKTDINSVRGSEESFNIPTKKPFEFVRTKSQPQYKSSNERSRLKNKEVVTPNYSGSTVSSTSRPLVPTSEFNSNINQQTTPRDQYQPNYSTHNYKEALNQNFPTSYQSIYDKPTSTTEPIFDQPGKIYTYNRVPSVYEARLQPEQNYQTSTYGPSSSKILSTIPGAQSESYSTIPSGTYPQLLPGAQNIKKYYEPIKSEYFNTVTSKLPNYATPGTKVFQTFDHGYVYGPPGLSFTAETTPGYSISSTTPTGQMQGYSTTQGPVYPSTEKNYEQTLVNDFIQPINFEPGHAYVDQQPFKNQGTSFGIGQILERPGTQSSRNDFPQAIKSPSYTEYYDKPKIIGENFIGPKQPQGFNPETGYQYK